MKCASTWVSQNVGLQSPIENSGTSLQVTFQYPEVTKFVSISYRLSQQQLVRNSWQRLENIRPKRTHSPETQVAARNVACKLHSNNCGSDFGLQSKPFEVKNIVHFDD